MLDSFFPSCEHSQKQIHHQMTENMFLNIGGLNVHGM